MFRYIVTKNNVKYNIDKFLALPGLILIGRTTATSIPRLKAVGITFEIIQ